MCGLAKSGNILANEVSIIQNKKKETISEIFLLKERLSSSNLKILNRQEDFRKKKSYLNNLGIKPSLNPELKSIIKDSDVIIYGPGIKFISISIYHLTKSLGLI